MSRTARVLPWTPAEQPATRGRKRQIVCEFQREGVTVRVFYKPRTPYLQLAVHHAKGREIQRSLGHRDETAAQMEAMRVLTEELAAPGSVVVAKRTGPLSNSGPRTESAPSRPQLVRATLGEIIDRYLQSNAFVAGVRGQAKPVCERTQADRRETLLFMMTYKNWRHLPPEHLDQEQLLGYFLDRSVRDEATGTVKFERPAKPGWKGPAQSSGGARRAQAELQMLRVAVNWAHRTFWPGTHTLMVPENVFERLTIPGAGDPLHTPAISPERAARLWAIRDQMHPAFGVAFKLAYVYGKRGNSIRFLEWTDINFDEHTINWDRSKDKTGATGTWPLPLDVEQELLAWRDHPNRPDSPWLIAAPRWPKRAKPGDPRPPIARQSFLQWMPRAFKKAGLTRLPHEGWHSFRRSFSTRNADSAKTAMKIQGMSELETFLRYQQPDMEDVKRVLANRAPLDDSERARMASRPVRRRAAR